jgi:hypothetical protein
MDDYDQCRKVRLRQAIIKHQPRRDVYFPPMQKLPVDYGFKISNPLLAFANVATSLQ